MDQKNPRTFSLAVRKPSKSTPEITVKKNIFAGNDLTKSTQLMQLGKREILAENEILEYQRRINCPHGLPERNNSFSLKSSTCATQIHFNINKWAHRTESKLKIYSSAPKLIDNSPFKPLVFLKMNTDKKSMEKYRQKLKNILRKDERRCQQSPTKVKIWQEQTKPWAESLRQQAWRSKIFCVRKEGSLKITNIKLKIGNSHKICKKQ